MSYEFDHEIAYPEIIEALKLNPTIPDHSRDLIAESMIEVIRDSKLWEFTDNIYGSVEFIFNNERLFCMAERISHQLFMQSLEDIRYFNVYTDKALNNLINRVAKMLKEKQCKNRPLTANEFDYLSKQFIRANREMSRRMGVRRA